MAIQQDRFSRAFSFVLHDNVEVFPLQIERRDTGMSAYRVSRGGTGGNTLESGEEVDETTMIRKVLDLGWAVRCASTNGARQGLYKPNMRSVREIRRRPAAVAGVSVRTTTPPASDDANRTNAKTGLIEKFASVLCGATTPVVRDPRLLMDASGDVKIYYAPFEYINPQARIVLVGITPGPTQMVNANNEARRVLLAGRPNAEAIQAAKNIGAFSGEPLRSNLISQLNHWGFHHWLGLGDSAELFAGSRHLVQTTSLLRYPVFVKDDDYRGTPDMTKHPLLRKYLLENFATEVDELEDAVFVGLGPQVQKVLDCLIQERVLNANRVVGGMLHPSGNNTYRVQYLVGDRNAPVPHATNPGPYDEGRESFGQRFL